MGRIGKLCYAGLFFTPFMGCAQIDHASHGLVRPPGALPGGRWAADAAQEGK